MSPESSAAEGVTSLVHVAEGRTTHKPETCWPCLVRTPSTVPNRVPNSGILTCSNCTERHSNARIYRKCAANGQLVMKGSRVRVRASA